MKYALLTLCLLGAIVHTTNGAIAQPAEISREQIEVHSVVVDAPKVITLPPASGEIWDMLQSSGQLAEPPPVTDQADLKIELFKVNSSASIRSSPSPSGELIGIAPAGAEVQVASRDSGWVQIIDPWSWRTGWIYSKFLAPSTPAGAINAAASSVRGAS